METLRAVDGSGFRVFKRKGLTTVGIWKPVREILTAHAKRQLPRPVVADLVSMAILEYLQRHDPLLVEQARAAALNRPDGEERP